MKKKIINKPWDIPTRRVSEETSVTEASSRSRHAVLNRGWKPQSRSARASLTIRTVIVVTACFAFAVVTNASEPVSSRSRQASEAIITASVSKDKVQVAEPFTLALKVTAPSGTRIMLPAVGKQLGDFDVLDHQDVSDIPSGDNTNERIWTRRMTLESIATGDLEIPVLEVQVASGAESRIINSDSVPIHVISVLEGRTDPPQLRDIHSVVDIDVPQSNSNAWIWWLAGGGGSFLVLAAASVFIVAKRKSWLTPSQWALNELGALSQSKAAELGDSESDSQQLSSILRDYLELQFEISAPVQTTQQLLGVIESTQLLNSKIAKRFADIFESADLAKFAGVQLTPAEFNSAIDEARELVAEASSGSVISEASTGSRSHLKGTN